MSEFNVALLVIVIIVCILVFLVNIYVLINYQHPDDYNQAWLPKIVVVLGLSVAQISILMLPADVANKHACSNSIYNGACKLTLPMKKLWLAIWIIDSVLVFFVIPFAIFYYEGDQEKTVPQRVVSAMLWESLTAVIVGLVLGILYGLVGKVDFTVRRLSSTTVPFTTDFSFLSQQFPCLSPTNMACAAYTTETASTTTWTMRTTFPEYVIALTTIVGSLLFSIFGGIGIACLPLSMIFSFLRRPRKIITRARYIKEATDLGKRAKELREITLALQREERTGGKGRKWRRNVKKVEQELVYLEEDVQALEEVYPQGERAETSWALTVLGYLFKLLLGVFGFCVSVMWVAHIIVYMLVQPPAAPLLNQVFVKLDNAWGLLGTVAFAIFCMYLILAVIAGEMHLGMNLIFITIHPMKYGGTLMNSFLFNVGLILLCSISVIQFCAKAFSLYAQATAVQEIFGYTLESLRGLKYLFRYNVFQFVFILLSIGTLIYYLAYGWKKKQTRGKMHILE
ncbi:hypothetical protein O6H91_18G037000 [Diphasiastrum complanatum]|uniref:Uncharacterized protein n=1 Tax=Diphasiastrum complanatum TaxID=34168 RepID=A0ACC2AZT3_DIPCM|nr:hypothetical protein O6H91_18G037000 [Diphasiastrum complanatum]